MHLQCRTLTTSVILEQEWFSHWQENNCRQYLTVIITRITRVIVYIIVNNIPCADLWEVNTYTKLLWYLHLLVGSTLYRLVTILYYCMYCIQLIPSRSTVVKVLYKTVLWYQSRALNKYVEVEIDSHRRKLKASLIVNNTLEIIILGFMP